MTKMAANDSKSYLGYLNKFVDEYIYSHHLFIGKNPIDTNYFDMTEEIETNPKAPKFKVDDRVKITKHKNVFSKGYTDKSPKQIFVINSVLKTDPWKKIIGNVYEKKLFLSYYPEPDSYVRDKVKVLLKLLNCATKKN